MPSALPTSVIEVAGLRKDYGTTAAMAGIDLSIERGAVVAILGPNGAGTTTLVEILEGDRTPTAEVRAHVLVLLAWGVAAVAVAVKWFRWEARP